MEESKQDAFYTGNTSFVVKQVIVRNKQVSHTFSHLNCLSVIFIGNSLFLINMHILLTRPTMTEYSVRPIEEGALWWLKVRAAMLGEERLTVEELLLQ